MRYHTDNTNQTVALHNTIRLRLLCLVQLTMMVVVLMVDDDFDDTAYKMMQRTSLDS